MDVLRGKKVLVAMSGGVDSSVAAALLKDAGCQVVGCFMRLGSEEENRESKVPNIEAKDAGSLTLPAALGTGNAPPPPHGCCSLNDAADARLVAALLDIPFYVLNFRADFNRIIDYFVVEYNAGRTPNPCVRCNDWLKFGKLLTYAQSIDADYVATGHYARTDRSTGTPRLLRGLDPAKDQSYVLFGSPRARLAHMLLPIGGLHKTEVRRIAQEKKLPVFAKPDSQEICFVPNDDYASLIHRRTPDQVHPGAVLDTQGRVVGRHPGQQHLTIGQRRGIGVALGYPIYVVGKDAAANTVTVGPKEALLHNALQAEQTNWLIDPPPQPRRCQAKIRYNSPPAPAIVRVTGPDTLQVVFDQPQSAISPGQAVVCYDGDHLLGGGWIRGTGAG